MKILNREKEIQNDEKITIPIDELQPFEEHPYKVLDDEEMEQLVESIRENGVLTPILVTHLDLRAEKYDIVSGHRRYAACKKLGITEILQMVDEGRIALTPAVELSYLKEEEQR
ncbi:MAG: ParB/RepB/Spo0J family partition protein [Acutalibacteraceae bacterium]